MDARTRWTVLTTTFAAVLIVFQAHALREPLTAEKPSDVYSAWWRWLIGKEPVHPRRRWAVPLFAVFWFWFVGHITLGWGPNDLPRRRPMTPAEVPEGLAVYDASCRPKLDGLDKT